MRFDSSRCLECGKPGKPEPDFIVPGTNFWFCCLQHYIDAYARLMDKKYSMDKEASGDPEFKEIWTQYADEEGDLDELRNDIRAFVRRWNAAYKKELDRARDELHNRIIAEYEHQQTEQKEKQRIAEEKERVAREKEEAKLEEERLAREAADQRLEPRPIPDNIRFEHTHILGGTGVGKSTLLIKHFLEDIEKDASIVVIDCKGTMVEQLRQLEVFNPHEPPYSQRLIVIDPTLFPPAINMFAPPKRIYEGKVADHVLNNTVSLLSYVFSSKESSLTDKQLTPLSFAIGLLFSIPGADMRMFLKLLNDPPNPKGGMRPDSFFKPYIDEQDDTVREFFNDYFYSKEYEATKSQIAARIYGLLRDTTFRSMLNASENNVDFFQWLQQGKVVLISVPVALLGVSGTQLFSRYMVALTLAGAFERITIPKKKWKPAYLIIDEAQFVMDEVKTQELLQQAREFKLGVTLAHQQIKGQLTETLFSTLSANTAIKYCATRSSQDASAMARDMRCEPEFITNQKLDRDARKAHFACFAAGVTDHPFSLELELGAIDRYRKMDTSTFNSVVGWSNIYIGISEPAINADWTDEEWARYEETRDDPRGATIIPKEYEPVPGQENMYRHKADTQKAPGGPLAVGAQIHGIERSTPGRNAHEPIITHEGPTKAEPSRVHSFLPAEADKPIIHDDELNRPAPWKPS